MCTPIEAAMTTTTTPTPPKHLETTRRLIHWAYNAANYLVAGVIGAAVVGLIQHWIETNHDNASKHLRDQIEKVYQPFYYESMTNDSTWCAFVQGVWRTTGPLPTCFDARKSYWDSEKLPEQDVLRWRNVIKTVFQPLNLKMEGYAKDNPGLLIGYARPPKWDALIRNVESYKRIIGEWEEEEAKKRPISRDRNANFPMAELYPTGLTECSRKILEALNKELDRMKANPFIWSTSGNEKVLPKECQT
jgi:hypothetical protein